jgi:transcription elongation factor Elf1
MGRRRKKKKKNEERLFIIYTTTFSCLTHIQAYEYNDMKNTLK